MTDDIVKEVIHDKLKTIEWLKNKLEQQQKQVEELEKTLCDELLLQKVTVDRELKAKNKRLREALEVLVQLVPIKHKLAFIKALVTNDGEKD
jgi:hypothetical protein